MPQASHGYPIGSPRPVEFERPPVAETILGVQFAPLEGFTLPYVALLWSRFRDRYPNHEVKPPLSPVVEELSGPPRPTTIGIELTSDPSARFWFIDVTSTQLIQVQRDRFIRNWRKGPPPHDVYPRYDDLRPRFEQDWQTFLHFLTQEQLAIPAVNQCEVTYVNHVELGAGWNSLGEAHKVLTLLRQPPSGGLLPNPEALVVHARYVMPERRGRLYVECQPAIRRHDGKQVMQLTLTARGRPASSDLRSIVEWFDLGHDWIVHGFVDITTPVMHELWGRR